VKIELVLVREVKSDLTAQDKTCAHLLYKVCW
jgi:hypothetical protein